MEYTPSDTTPLWEGEHLSLKALARWRDHLLSPDQVVAASEHLARCAQCRTQLAAPAALVLLGQALDNGQSELGLLRSPEVQHLKFEQMEAFVDELLTPAGRRNVELHLSRCSVCSEQVNDLRAVQLELHEWENSAQRALENPAEAAAASVTANGAATYQTATSAGASPNVAPAMRVQLPRASRERTTRDWATLLRNVQRFLLPLETAGVAVAALFLLLIVPSRQELERLSAANQKLADEKELTQAELDKRHNQNERFESQLKGLQQRVARLDKKSTASRQQSQQLAKNNAALTSRLNDSQSQLRSLQDQQRRDRKRIAQLPSITPPQVGPRTTLPRSGAPLPKALQVFPDGPNAFILRQGGSAVRVTNAQTLSSEATRALTQGLQIPPEVKALRVPAPTSKSTESQLRFRVLSPVGTRLRIVCPHLRWETVPQATSYRVTLADETDLEAPLLKSGPLTGARWQPEAPLIRGHRYTWTVQAWRQDERSGKLRLLGDAPRKPDLSATFELLSQAQEDALRTQLATVQDSPLQKSLILARSGVMDEAQQQLALVTRPGAFPRPHLRK